MDSMGSGLTDTGVALGTALALVRDEETMRVARVCSADEGSCSILVDEDVCYIRIVN